MANIILIHGSWHGAWCWYKVKPRLESKGHTVLNPDLPAHGQNRCLFPGLVTLADMVKSITKHIDAIEEKSILVVHSRSGIIASQLAEIRPHKIEKIIYLASFMLKNGERAAEFFLSDRDSLLKGNISINKFLLTDMIQKQIYTKALYADCTTEDIALAHSLLSPEPSLPALTRLKLSERNFGKVRRFYIELTQDRAVSIELQRKFIQQTGCEKVFSIEAGHSAYFSKPDELSDIINKIINEI